jgi:hypothetical protein
MLQRKMLQRKMLQRKMLQRKMLRKKGEAVSKPGPLIADSAKDIYERDEPYHYLYCLGVPIVKSL